MNDAKGLGLPFGCVAVLPKAGDGVASKPNIPPDRGLLSPGVGDGVAALVANIILVFPEDEAEPVVFPVPVPVAGLLNKEPLLVADGVVDLIANLEKLFPSDELPNNPIPGGAAFEVLSGAWDTKTGIVVVSPPPSASPFARCLVALDAMKEGWGAS